MYVVLVLFQMVFDVIHEVVDDLYFEIMVGPEAFELIPHVSVVLNRLAVSCTQMPLPSLILSYTYSVLCCAGTVLWLTVSSIGCAKPTLTF